MTNSSGKKYKGTANPDYIAAMRELRRSSAASPQDSRPNRERSRSAAKRAEIRRQTESRTYA